MVRSHVIWLAPIAAATISFALDVTRAIAQTTYPFEATYNSENSLVPITENVSRVTITAQSTDAPYGLTNYVNTNYSLINPDTGAITFSPDAADFGLEGLPIGGSTFFGQGNDKLFGTNSGTGTLDFQNLVGMASGTETITGGSGKFRDATGIFSVLEKDILSTDPTAPIKGWDVVSGSFQTFQSVPEPRHTTVLVGMGVIGVGFGLRRRKVGVAG